MILVVLPMVLGLTFPLDVIGGPGLKDIVNLLMGVEGGSKSFVPSPDELGRSTPLAFSAETEDKRRFFDSWEALLDCAGDLDLPGLVFSAFLSFNFDFDLPDVEEEAEAAAVVAVGGEGFKTLLAGRASFLGSARFLFEVNW